MREEYRVIVCGGRAYGLGPLAKFLRGILTAALTEVQRCVKENNGRLCIVTGGCSGADALAHAWAKDLDPWIMGPASGIELYADDAIQVMANWGKYGKGAGPMRNQAMLDGGASLVVAFPGGKGTADMMRRARTKGVPIWEPLTGEPIPRFEPIPKEAT